MPQSGLIQAETLGPLAERGWLSEQPQDLIQWMARHGRWRTYDSKQILYQAGEAPDGLYGLGEGALEVTLPLIGDEPIAVHRAEPGFWVGESAALSAGSRTISLSAAATSRVFRVPAASLKTLLAQEPKYWPCFYALSHINVTTALTLLAEALSLSPKARLARLFLRIADSKGQIAVSQTDLSRLIGMNRSSLQRAMNDLVESGTMATGYRSLWILNRPGLERMVNEA